MTYPEPRYLGDTGELTATMRRADAGPDLVFPNGTKAHYLATGASTDGAYGLYRWEMGPEPGGASPHFHRTMTESFYVLSGTVKLYDGSDWVDTTPGGFVHVPVGGVHGFRNESGEPATMLILFTPGAPREGYFEGLVTASELTDEEREALYLEHDNIYID